MDPEKNKVFRGPENLKNFHGFLKKLFNKPKKITLTAIEIEDWISENMSKFIGSEYQIIDETKSLLDKNKKELLEKLKTLETAELVNPKISEHEKQVMQGNKNNYILKTKQFVETIKIPQDYLKIDEFCNEFEETLTDYNEKTIKSYHVLKSFFRDEMLDLSSSLKKIEELHLSLFNTMKKQEIIALKTILIRVKELNNNIEQSNSLLKEIGELETEYKTEKEKKVTLDKKLEKIKQSPNYNNLKKYQAKKKYIDDEVSELRLNFLKKLKVFEKPLKKYIHQTQKHTDYLQDPLFALEKDYQFSILLTLDKIKNDIDKYNLKDNQKNKLSTTIIDRNFLKEIRKKYIDLKKEKADVQKSEDNISVMMDFKEIEYQKEHNDSKIEKLKENIVDKKNLFNHLNIEDKKQKLKSRLCEFSKYEVTIET